MSTYLALLNFTQQGLQNIQESPNRAAAFKAAAKKAGVKVTNILWTLGEFDGAILYEAKDDAAATGLMLSLSSLGNVHTKTLRAFTAAEFSDIVAKVPKM
ncbi:MAG: GYD domain-containing protein [Prosthecobacter sp.]|nr:GYD domain-containing protein [Prosthecobacter sp.]